MDLRSWHLTAYFKNELAAYTRVVDPGIKYGQPSIGRVMTLVKFRNLKIGRSLMSEAISFTEQEFPEMDIKIGAQAYLQIFYESLGFEAVSKRYDEDGIPHMDMVRPSINTDLQTIQHD